MASIISAFFAAVRARLAGLNIVSMHEASSKNSRRNASPIIHHPM